MTSNDNKSTNVVWHEAQVSREMREQMNGHKGCVLWFTGLSGAGKSTLAHAVEERLHQMDARTFVIDGDNVRHGLCADLNFSDEDRVENIRRVGEVAGLFVQAGLLTLTAFISPFRADRDRVRHILGNDFIEIYCDTPLDVCESRDVKGLYKRARAGEIPAFTGISSPYEAPENPEIRVNTGHGDLHVCVDQVIAYLQQREILF
ncbi:MAG: adenylyl-sulfate kinase [Zetaproteobacteria bacterium CG_4_9_14_3_um_filter_49_83]|nr:MAG: adenylyl-sulfate kinase [Zetaproteobacteria bacterium CG1_02_49_23]PIQ32758.1 MAG: adenylyl-sulfate kinase [Zetaproteobacteria bacterium CG17_big_fil_post_rev_8_21_14_2_50_50_13]PIV29616.1 MAG: adenylyl-sulfate kinase [Zetaproteobacteria bacterium CG02_land_8_20_14_3_00_50_9]PIY54954.1 MAG: adenylyl-sulfate kinase [Zetaproteobacteria bacterium CG_4_10_14_0_8_um_filter_49_80]PJA35312.1 MAG: adenylyl-sulfate kinase [Zetaproteobacteria bacterium CG_4_9_14_3_um_filter_49_83]